MPLPFHIHFKFLDESWAVGPVERASFLDGLDVPPRLPQECFHAYPRWCLRRSVWLLNVDYIFFSENDAQSHPSRGAAMP
jgi:hypothetical protein